MRPRHPLPKTWLFSDERTKAGAGELAALLPPGSGIVLRHDSLPAGARWRLLRRLMRIARVRRLTVLLAGSPATARRWGADGVHLRQRDALYAKQARLRLLLTMPVHDAAEARRARRSGADGVFISPLHPTRSHPGAPTLGRASWLRLARLSGAKPIALGGMTLARLRALNRASRIDPGWAAIDAWEEKATKRRKRQKRNAVPT
ncbi:MULTISPECIES: thiamine phosphate synthase [unclassified Sphingopyxis]|jgi:thiamine-phosphate pyrophosphorylase|uniref:thiamine phosphate synthase n=1 Tax=unclassified Sphingopyxis TaxID=2614943 RepID=UPI0006C391D3|nr:MULTISPECIES: thiamine phosphate synthase [unclassified Sphingopyxis]USI76788.1 thiamine phosphate synthase [Sphingopyxis sp. USTB-05]GAO80782.1 thiamin-phosphate pyrophosphorylase [Sphingopyxis sp. C-1]